MTGANANSGLWKGNLRSTWQELGAPMKLGAIAIAVAVGLVFVLRVLPYLFAAMGIGMLLAVLFIPYWIPTIVAFVRKHPSKGAVFALNFFFGWTFVGWVVSLVWALSLSHAQQQVIMVNTTVVAGNVAHAPPHQVGDIVDGRRFNGMSWVPVEGNSGGASLPPGTQYRVGDIVNGYRFDGVAWLPVQQARMPGPPPEAPSA